MVVYCIYFEDGSNYIGATKTTVEKRVANHLSKWRSRKYQIRDIYKKMDEFNGKFKFVSLSNHDSADEMYRSEVANIALFKGEKNLNNSTGGSVSSKGKKANNETRLKIKQAIESRNPSFEIYCKNTKKLLYKGRSQTEAGLQLMLSSAAISYGLSRAKKNYCSERKRKNNARFIYVIPGVGYSDSV